jgi:hypothetical protein
MEQAGVLADDLNLTYVSHRIWAAREQVLLCLQDVARHCRNNGIEMATEDPSAR